MKALLFLALAVAIASADIFADIRALSPTDISEHSWVVLAAGSSGWSNYRHQADVCHVYQGIHALGVPDHHIIVMMYDDIASNSQNPTKGVIINEPNGPNVYEGVIKDYTGQQVSAANFMKVMTGDATGVGTGKVLNSTEEDNVFLFFDDHGGPGIIAFPVGQLSATQFESTINKMAERKMYKKLVLYVQACYSGSMFYLQKLPPNVYGVSSAPIQASAYAFEYDTVRRAYLASRWSYGFAHQLEVSPGLTLQEQFDGEWEWVKNWSLPCQYGDLTIPREETFRSLLVADYNRVARHHRHHKHLHHHPLHHKASTAVPEGETVPDYLVPYELARHKYESSKTDAALFELRHEQDVRDAIDKRIYSVLAAAAPKAPHFRTVPCDKCDNTCDCIRNCGTSATCKFECCDEKACYQKNPTDGIDCGMKLGQAWATKCAPKDNHDYSSIAYRHFFRACRNKYTDVEAGLKTIDALCA